MIKVRRLLGNKTIWRKTIAENLGRHSEDCWAKNVKVGDRETIDATNRLLGDLYRLLANSLELGLSKDLQRILAYRSG